MYGAEAEIVELSWCGSDWERRQASKRGNLLDGGRPCVQAYEL